MLVSGLCAVNQRVPHPVPQVAQRVDLRHRPLNSCLRIDMTKNLDYPIPPEDAYRLEMRVLGLSRNTAAVMAAVGLAFAYLANSQVILLDGLFNIVLFLMVGMSISMSRRINQGPDHAYHFGYGGYEPFLVMARAAAALILTAYASLDAVQTIIRGGSEVRGLLALGYSVVLGVSCTVVALRVRAAWKRTGWPTIQAEYITWILNGVISSATGLALFGSGFLRGTSLEWAVPYADPLLVIVMSLVLLPVPLRMLTTSFRELMGRAPVERLESQRAVEAIVPEGFSIRTERAIRTGRSEFLAVRIAADPGTRLEQCDEIRRAWGEERDRRFPNTWAVLVFSNRLDAV